MGICVLLCNFMYPPINTKQFHFYLPCFYSDGWFTMGWYLWLLIFTFFNHLIRLKKSYQKLDRFVWIGWSLKVKHIIPLWIGLYWLIRISRDKSKNEAYLHCKPGYNFNFIVHTCKLDVAAARVHQTSFDWRRGWGKCDCDKNTDFLSQKFRKSFLTC